MKLFIAATCVLSAFFMSKTVNTMNLSIPCSDDDSCRQIPSLPSDAVCKNGFCACFVEGVQTQCISSPVLLSSTKISSSLIGRLCKSERDCNIVNGICNTTMSQCLCKHEFVSNTDGNKCLPVVISIGGKCEDNKQCFANLPHTTCLDNQCVCIDGFHYAEKICFKSMAVGEKCKNTQECSHTEHAECNQENVCVCSYDTILNSENKRCLPLARELSQQCVESAQCNATLGINAECIDKHCQCASTAHFVPEIHKCVINKYVDDSCNNDNECYQDELSSSQAVMKCANSICQCTNLYIKNGNKCVFNTASATVFKLATSILLLPLLVLKS